MIKEQKLYKDAKSLLQEIVQGQGFETPDYQVMEESGPDHEKEFTVRVLINKKEVSTGTGRSKQHAQQDAARHALEKMDKE
jgi:ribonuclease III